MAHRTRTPSLDLAHTHRPARTREPTNHHLTPQPARTTPRHRTQPRRAALVGIRKRTQTPLSARDTVAATVFHRAANGGSRTLNGQSQTSRLTHLTACVGRARTRRHASARKRGTRNETSPDSTSRNSLDSRRFVQTLVYADSAEFSRATKRDQVRGYVLNERRPAPRT